MEIKNSTLIYLGVGAVAAYLIFKPKNASASRPSPNPTNPKTNPSGYDGSGINPYYLRGGLGDLDLGQKLDQELGLISPRQQNINDMY